MSGKEKMFGNWKTVVGKRERERERALFMRLGKQNIESPVTSPPPARNNTFLDIKSNSIRFRCLPVAPVLSPVIESCFLS